MESKKGAVFIFAFFKYDIDWVSMQSPPNPQVVAAIGNVKSVILSFANALSPRVHSINPSDNPFPIEALLKITEKKLITGLINPVFNKISERR